MPESIQEYLQANGFKINETMQRFETASVSIPFGELRNHTVSSFKEKAIRQGWIKPQEQGEKQEKATYNPYALNLSTGYVYRAEDGTAWKMYGQGAFMSPFGAVIPGWKIIQAKNRGEIAELLKEAGEESAPSPWSRAFSQFVKDNQQKIDELDAGRVKRMEWKNAYVDMVIPSEQVELLREGPDASAKIKD